MKRLPLVLAALALASAASAKSICREQRQRAEPPPPMKGLRIHEWGVFLAGKAGTRAAAGSGESPGFLQKISVPEAPDPDAEPDECREPVIHVYAPQAMDLKASVSFSEGAPELAWPTAEATRRPYPTLSWSLKVLKEDGPETPKVPEGHWIAAARKAGSDLLVSKDGRAERFLFYEGRSSVPSEAEVACENGEYTFFTHLPTDLWVVEGGKSLRCARAHGPLGLKNVPRAAEAVEEEALRKELSAALVKAGLNEPEAGALLTAWMPELSKPGARLLYLLPREDYDRLLPVEFAPSPEEFVRVGLVVREVSP